MNPAAGIEGRICARIERSRPGHTVTSPEKGCSYRTSFISGLTRSWCSTNRLTVTALVHCRQLRTALWRRLTRGALLDTPPHLLHKSCDGGPDVHRASTFGIPLQQVCPKARVCVGRRSPTSWAPSSWADRTVTVRLSGSIWREILRADRPRSRSQYLKRTKRISERKGRRSDFETHLKACAHCQQSLQR